MMTRNIENTPLNWRIALSTLSAPKRTVNSVPSGGSCRETACASTPGVRATRTSFGLPMWSRRSPSEGLITKARLKSSPTAAYVAAIVSLTVCPPTTRSIGSPRCRPRSVAIGLFTSTAPPAERRATACAWSPSTKE